MNLALSFKLKCELIFVFNRLNRKLYKNNHDFFQLILFYMEIYAFEYHRYSSLRI